MSYQPFEIYLFEEASKLNSTRYNFVDKLKENVSGKDDPILCLKNGLRFLEMNCSLLYGYTGECIGTTEPVMKNIPVAFDSALILPLLLDTGISPNIVTSLQSLLKNDQRESGFWNFFLRNSSKGFDVLPEDIDDTGNVAMSLFLGKILSREECIKIADKMREHFLYDDDGLIGTFFKPTIGDQDTRKILWKHFSKNPRIDIGSCLNCFWFFGYIGLDHILAGQEFRPTMRLINRALEEIDRNEEVITHARYYTNPSVLLFLLSRFVKASKFGEELFGNKLVDIIMKKMVKNHEKDETVIEIACQIMTAMNMNLLSDPNYTNAESHIFLKMKMMMALQLPDGSFPRAPVYIWTPYTAAAASGPISTAFAVAAIKMVLDFGFYENTEKDLV